MGLFEQLPYTNFHEQNLAYILEELKKQNAAIGSAIEYMTENIEETVREIMQEKGYRKFLFVGDSYIASHNNTCVELACSYLGITDYENLGVSGASFHDGTFLAQIQNYVGDRDAITDIFVIGGLNDSIYSSYDTTLEYGISAFMQYVSDYYKNAAVSVCFAGHALEDSAVLYGRTWEKRCFANWMYENIVSSHGGVFYPDLWTYLAVNESMLAGDKLHPSVYGNDSLANGLVQAIKGNNIPAVYPKFQLSSDRTDIFYQIKGDVVEVFFSGAALFKQIGVQTIGGGDTLQLTSNNHIYLNKEVSIPCLARAYQCNGQVYSNLRGFIVMNGSTLSLQLSELSGSGFTQLNFSASNSNISIEKMDFSFPVTNLL